MYPESPNSPVKRPTDPYTVIPGHLPATISAHTPIPVENRRIVGYERYAGDLLVPVYEALPVPAPPPPLPAQRADPIAQRLIAGGVGAGAAGAGLGWGAGQAITGIAELGSGAGLAAIVLLLLAARFGGGRTRIHNETHIHNTNRWLGRSTTTTHQR